MIEILSDLKDYFPGIVETFGFPLSFSGSKYHIKMGVNSGTGDECYDRLHHKEGTCP